MHPPSRSGRDTTRASAIAAEQRAVDRIYGLLDAETTAASTALHELARADTNRTPAAVAERDALLAAHAGRLAALRAAEDKLCFGRLDLTDGTRHYVGRVGLSDPDGSARALLDWRAPAAAAFYRATRAQPLGVARRRHLSVRGRRVAAVTDELLHPEAAAAVDGGAHLDADAALFAALNAPRDGQMHDVVATIQAEQDRIIRAPLPGVLVVQGGPGTGKTVVALHRAAYLLFTHRERLRSGVLVVGPGQRFLDYISQVLPSLGEDGTTLRTLGRLHDGCDAHATDLPAVAALKGELRMAGVLAAAVADLRPLPPAAEPQDVDGTLIHLHPADVAAAARAALQERLPHIEGRVPFVNHVLERLLRHLATALGHQPGELADGERLELLRTLHASLDVRRAVNRCWPMVTAEQLVRRLLSTPGVLDRCAPGLTAEERALLRRPREAAWTVSDVPLLAEAATLLGEDPEPRRRAAARAVAERAAEVRYARAVAELTGPAGAMVDAATLADRYAGAQEVDDAADATVFGHVVVDEAQELTPMQWRAVLRRCPTRSLTVVGDMAQATSPGAATSWARALAPHLGDRWMLRELTVNYRLPQAINEFAQGVLSAAGVAATPFWSVRDGHDPLHQHHLPDVAAAARLAARLARQERAGSGAGSVAIICPPQHQAAIERVLDRRASDGERPVRILGANEVKGLEFDVVLVVDPDAIDAAAGPRSLFVALTRATQRLHVLTVSAGTGDLADGARP